MDKTRDLRFDNFKGVLIVLVVVGHYFWGYRDVSDPVSFIVRLIYIFHMPAFIFISGYFSKDTHSISWRGIAELLVSYFLINTTIMVFSVLYRGSDISLLSPYYSCWYLLALVVWRMSLPFFAQFRFMLVLSVALSIAVGFSPEITNKFALARTIAFYPFFIGGYLCRKADLSSRLSSKFSHVLGWILFVFALVVAYFAISELGITTSDEMMQAYSGSLGKDMLRRIVILVIAAGATLGLLAALPSRRLPFLSTWGKNSLTIYLFHRFFPLIMLGLLPATQFSDSPWGFVAALVLSFITSFIFGLNKVESGYRFFVKHIVDVMFAVPQENDRLWVYKQALVLLVACVAMVAMVAQGLVNT